jgi:hypothetical protein
MPVNQRKYIPWNKGKTTKDDVRIFKLAHWKGRKNIKRMRQVTIVCDQCGNKFHIKRSLLGRKKRCSKECSKKAKLGRIPWNKNLRGVTKANKGSFKKGEIPCGSVLFNNGHTPWNKGKVFDNISREKHWNWKGGKTPESKLARQTIKYKKWRKSVFEKDDYTCVKCGVRGGWLEADHIIPFVLSKEKRYEVSNGQTLCRPCHLEKCSKDMIKIIYASI